MPSPLPPPRTGARRPIARSVAALAALAAVTAATGAAPAQRVTGSGAVVYVANMESDTVSVVSSATGVTLREFPAGDGPVDAALAPDGRHLYVADMLSSTLTVIDTATEQVTATAKVGDHPQALAVSPDGAAVYVAGGSSAAVSVFDTAAGQVTATIPVEPNHDIAVAPDGKHAYLAMFDKGVGVLDLTTRALTGTVAAPNAGQLALSDDGTRGYVSNGYGGPFQVFDTATGTVLREIPVGGSGIPLASHDGKRVYVSDGQANTVAVFDTATGDKLADVPVGPVTQDLALSSDDRTLYATDFNDQTLQLIDTTTNQLTTTATGFHRPTGVAVPAAAPASADVAVKLTAGALSSKLLTLTYTLTVTNNGPGKLTSATVDALLPESASTGEDDCTIDAGKATCTIGALDVGASTTRTFAAPLTAALGKSYKASATRTASSPADPEPGNDTSEVTCNVGLTVACL
ncbi:beta-propeller fold lactonase family protein [Kitasatospora phosalacinea]|uniref:YVTN family beta-propeller repeat protein n=1 Tax=Kitasatospora phosalacinea TaxID=2065 RepID=UPI00365CA388